MARKMKDSGIEWIGEIPEGWSIARGKHILTLLQRAVFPTDGVITCFRDGEVTLRSNRREDGFTVSLKEIGYQGIEPGDLVVHGMDGFAGSIGISDSRGKSSPVLVVLDSSQDKKYLMYYLRSMAYNNVFLALSTGIRVRSCDLKWNKLADLLYLVPPIVEQHKLVSFLDEKCSEIDAMLSKTRASIEEYKKLKQAVITQAVTKGVRGEREMKDSGNPWFGQIPADWKLTRVGLHFSIILGKMLCNAPPNDTYTLEPYYCAADVHFDGVADGERKKMWFSPIEKDLYRVSVGDLLVVEGGAGAGGSAIVENQDSDTYIQNSIMIVRSKGNADNRYLRYLLEFLIKQGYIDIVCNKATIPHFTKDKLSCVPFCLCPTGEQKEIAAYLDAKCAEIDKLIAKKEQLVKELESYRKSLIYEVVTGKREV